MSKPKQVFSIRIDPEILRRIRRLARKEKTTIGAIVRESLDGLLKSKEKADESSHRENRSGECGTVDHGSVQSADIQFGPPRLCQSSLPDPLVLIDGDGQPGECRDGGSDRDREGLSKRHSHGKKRQPRESPDSENQSDRKDEK